SGCNPDTMDPPMGGQGVVSTVMLVINTSDFRIINGIRFNQIIEADIVYNNAFNNVLAASKDLEELITHDLGIAFGLDNSSSDANEQDPTLRESIMYFQPHLDKRGARLNTDDQTGVNRLYPFITPVQVNATTLPAGVFNVAYNAQVSAVGGTPPFTFAVTKGQVPTGLELNSLGIIAGIPTKIESQSFDVTVTDQANFRATRTFQISTTSLPPRIGSIANTRVSYNSNSMVTITGFNFSTVTDVRVTQGRLLAFRATDDNTLVLGLAGPGTTGVLTDITIVNPGGMISMPGAVLYDGPALKSAQAAKVRVRNLKGKFVNQKGIIIKGDGLTLIQQIRVNGTMVNLNPSRSDQGDIVYFGQIKPVIPAKGDFNVTIFDPGLNSESNGVKGKRFEPTPK
ncbi:MAG: putative Ig domain-containing protein, partial [bacterium]